MADSNRSYSIVRILERNDDWTTASALAAELGCSARTIKNDISTLNKRAAGVVLSGPKGYRLGDAAQAAELTARRDAGVPQNMDERKKHILFELLMRRRHVSSAELAEELCVSLATLDNELVSVKRELTGFGLRLRSSGGELFIEGDERGEKKLVNRLIFDETKDFFSQLDLVNGYFPDLDLKELQEKIEAALKSHGCFVNDYALSNLILHIAISVERASNGFSTPYPALSVSDSGSDEGVREEVHTLAEDIRRIIEDAYDIEMSPSDCESLHLLLSANLIRSDHLELGGEDHDTAQRLFDIIRERVADDFCLDFSNKEFELRFTLHLTNMVARMRLGVPLRNPQLASIKNGYPFIYDVAVSIANTVWSETGLSVDEDEIAYIALHVGCLVEEQRSQSDKLHAVLVSPRRTSVDAGQIKRFSERLGSDVVIDGVVPRLGALGTLEDIDLVISDITLTDFNEAPVVTISPFFNDRDVEDVARRARSIRRARARAEIEKSLQSFFSREFFLTDQPYADRDDALSHLGNLLIESGCAYDNFTACLLEREEVSSSAYQDIALPHPLDMDAKRTAVAVSLHPRGLRWGDTTVYAVFALAIRREERALFREIFDFIARVLTQPGAIRQIARARTFDEFVGMLLEYA